MGQSGIKRIRWDHDEKEGVISRGLELRKRERGLCGWVRIFRNAMKDTLPPDRHRKTNGLSPSQINWFIEEVERRRLQEKEIEEARDQPVDLSNTSTKDLLEEVMKRMASDLIKTLVPKIREEIEDILTTPQERDSEKMVVNNTPEPTIKKRTVLIIGLKNNQRNEIDRYFSSHFNLKYEDCSDLRRCTAAAKNADNIITMTSWARHQGSKITNWKGDLPKLCPGGITSLKGILNHLADQKIS